MSTNSNAITRKKSSEIQSFDYSSLDGDTQQKVQKLADKIRQKNRDIISCIIEVGNDLLMVKSSVGHGNFGAWLKHEFNWSEKTVQNYMNVAQMFKSETVTNLGLDPNKLNLSATGAYALASCSDSVQRSILTRAGQGEHIARETVLAVKSEQAGDIPIGDKASKPKAKDLNKVLETAEQLEVDDLEVLREKITNLILQRQLQGKGKSETVTDLNDSDKSETVTNFNQASALNCTDTEAHSLDNETILPEQKLTELLNDCHTISRLLTLMQDFSDFDKHYDAAYNLISAESKARLNGIIKSDPRLSNLDKTGNIQNEEWLDSF